MKEKRNREGRLNSGFARWRARRRTAWAKKTKGQRIRTRVLQVLGVVALVLVLGLAGLKWYVQMPDLPEFETGDSSSMPAGQMPGVSTLNRKKGVYTFLVVGRDVASGSTDTMILLTYDTKEKTIHGLNLPRDTMVNVDTRSKRLNAVFSSNKGKDKDKQVEKGMKALKDEVGKLTGIRPDFYVLVEWKAIGELVDAIGGVMFDVPFDMDYDDPYQDLHIHQKAGLRKLNGDDAMQVVRHRKNNDGSHSGGDVARMRVQQDFLMAVADKCLQPATFLKLPELARVFTENVETDLTMGNILALAQKASGMDADTDVVLDTAPIGAPIRYKGAALITLDPEELLEVLNNGMNPYKDELEMKDIQVVYMKDNGRLGITGGKLDPSLGGSGSSDNKPKPKPDKPKPKPDKPKPDPEKPVEPKPEKPTKPVKPEKPFDPDMDLPVEPEKPVDPKPVPPAPEPDKPKPDKPEPKPEPKPDPEKPVDPKPEPPAPTPDPPAPKPEPKPETPAPTPADPPANSNTAAASVAA